MLTRQAPCHPTGREIAAPRYFCVRLDPEIFVPGATDAVMNALPPMTAPLPMMVSPPRIVALA